MAKGDRVTVGDGYNWKEDGTSVMVYMPKLDEHGRNIITPDGGTVVAAVGGVKVGSTGVIDGPVINVHRSYLHNSTDYTPSYGGKDFVQMIPVFLEKYQRIGYFPVDNVRIFGSYVP